MPTLFDKLDEGLASIPLDSTIAAQAGHLTGIVNIVAGLVSDPPTDFTAFVRQLAEAPLPNLDLGGPLTANLNAIQDALPGDLGEIAGALNTVLDSLSSTVNTGLTNVLAQALEAVQALQRLLASDLTGGLRPDGTPPNGANAPRIGSDAAMRALVANAQDIQQGIDQTITTLDELPTPFKVESFLKWIQTMLAIPRADVSFLRAIPIIDELRDPLDTLITWEGMTPQEILMHVVASLQDTEAFVRQGKEAILDTPLMALTTLAAHFQTTSLAQVANDLSHGLEALRTAIESADLSSTGVTVTAMTTALDQYDTLRTDFEINVLEPLRASILRLEALPFDLEDQIHHIISVLQPSAALGDLSLLVSRPEPILTPGQDAAFAELENFLSTYLAFFKNLIDAIDITTLQAPLSSVADEVRNAARQLDQAIVGVTLEIQERFAMAESLLDEIDLSALTADVQAAINQFRDDLIQQLSDAFIPVREAIQQVVMQIDQAVDQFNPAVLVETFQETFQAITDVFNDPAIMEPLNAIRDTLMRVTQLLRDLSFAPVVDEVVAAIGDITSALDKIDTTVLPAPLQSALRAAIAALPQDITPITEPIVDAFGNLIETGPLPLVDAVKDQPQRLFDSLRAFEPNRLVGDALSAPYQALLTDMQGFRPSRLLDIVSVELDTFKNRVRQNADPALAIAPLVPLHEQLLQGFDALRPDDLIQSLETRINEVINRIVDILPVDELFEPLETVVGIVEDTLGIGDRFVALLQRLQDLLSGFTDSRSQLQTWVHAILAKVDTLTDTSPLLPPLAALTTALDGTRAGDLMGTFQESVAPLLALLDTLNPETQLANLVQAKHRIPQPALEALPDSPEKAAITTVLDRFDPTQPVFNLPYRALADMHTALNTATTNLADVLTEWDERYHGGDSILAGYRHTQATASQLRQWLEDALESQFITPLTALFEFLELGHQIVAAFIAPFQAVLTELQTKLANLLLGPDSLMGIRDALQELIQRLRDVNLAFIADTIGALFDRVRAQLEALDPANLQMTLNTAFEEMLQALDLSQAIPLDSLAQIDSTYNSILEKIEILEPQKVLTDVVQPLYDNTLIPLLDTFDLTPLLTTLVEKLGALEDELRQGIQQVNAAYQAFQRSASAVNDSASVAV